MRSTLAAVAFVVFAIGVSAQDTKKYESKEGKYSVAFPGKPTMTANKAGGIDLNIAIVEKGMGGFAVIHSDLPAEAVKAAKPKDLLEGGQKGLVDNFKAKVTSSKDFDFGKQKLPGAKSSPRRTRSTCAFRSSSPTRGSIRSSSSGLRTW